MDIIQSFKKALDKDQVLTNEAVKERYFHIWKMDIPLAAKAVLLPKTTEDVSAILKICHAHQQAIVVHGGLTNLVGSTETHKEEVVISMEKMNVIEEVDEMSRTMTVQAGVILENIHNAAKAKDLLFPLNFGAKGSAQIGGAISTNAGGLRVFRFGMTRNLVLGLETVLADGTIISSMKKVIKDNSAYDLKQLFIGSEGTLGVITKAVLKLSEAPKSRSSAFVACNEYEKVVQFLKFMDQGCAGTLSGFELLWKNTYQLLTTPPAPSTPPLPPDYNYYILVETLGDDTEKDRLKLEALLEKALEEDLILDAVVAYTESDLNWFWSVREEVRVISAACNHDQHFDISLPIPEIGSFVDAVQEKIFKIPEMELCFAFGHVADGNIHFIVGKSEHTERVINQINEVIYQPLQSLGGSVSAEHGIGLHKKAYLSLCRTPEEIQLMSTLKKAMDPLRILNRGKVLD